MDDAFDLERRRLVGVNVIAIAAMALHDADHVRQAIKMHDPMPVRVVVLLLLAYVPLGLSIRWARRGEVERASAATLAVVVLVMPLLTFAHLVGFDHVWQPLATLFGMWGQSYFAMHVDSLSWTALVVLAIAYTWLGLQVTAILLAQRPTRAG